MLRSPRLLAVVALWLVALWPLVLLVLGLAAPTVAVRAATFASRAAGWAAWGTAVLAAVAVVAYPPFLPALRLRLRRGWRRLGTSDKPVREAYARLAQFDNVNDHFLVGRHLREHGQPAAAVKHLKRAVELDAGHTNARYQLALALRDAGDLQGAVDELERVIAADRGFAAGQPMLDLVEILEGARMHREADIVLQEYRRLHGDTPLALYLHARALAGLGRRDESVALLRRAAQPPENPRPRSLEEDHARARARVALWFGGFR